MREHVEKRDFQQKTTNYFSYQVDNANVLDAVALAIKTSIQLKRFGANSTSNSNTITDNNVTLFDRHNAVRYAYVDNVRIRRRRSVQTARRLPNMKRFQLRIEG